MKSTAADEENRDTDNNSKSVYALTDATDNTVSATGPWPMSALISAMSPGAAEDRFEVFRGHRLRRQCGLRRGRR